MNYKDQNQSKDENQRIMELYHSLTFDDIKDDISYFKLLIKKHNPDGKFRMLDDVKISSLTSNKDDQTVQIMPSKAVIELMMYLFSKYKNPIKSQAVARKIYRDFVKVQK